MVSKKTGPVRNGRGRLRRRAAGRGLEGAQVDDGAFGMRIDGEHVVHTGGDGGGATTQPYFSSPVEVAACCLAGLTNEHNKLLLLLKPPKSRRTSCPHPR